MLINFLLKENLYCLNTFFQKPPQRKWTWKSPDDITKNEIDYIISNTRSICKDVTVLNKMSTGSDHRMVRADFYFDLQKERNKLTRKQRYPTIQQLTLKKDKYHRELQRRLQPADGLNIEQLSQNIETSIQISVKKICTTTAKKTSTNNKLSSSTLDLIKTRRNMVRGTVLYKETNKNIKKAIRKDIRTHNTKTIQETIEQNCNMKVLRSRLSNGKSNIIKLRTANGTILSNKKAILEEVENFYAKLYSTTKRDHGARTHVTNEGSEEIPHITTEEMEKALRQLKNSKCPGTDNITAKMIKLGDQTLLNSITALFNKCLHEGRIPEKWLEAEVILIFKKGDTTNIENYRPISLFIISRL